MSLIEHAPTQPPDHLVAPPRVNRLLVAACVIATLTEVIHVIGGGASVWRPIAESGLPDEPRLVSLAVWHMASVSMGLSAIAFGVGAHPRHAKPSRYMVILVSMMWIGFGLSFVGTALTETADGAFATLPQPVLLLPPGILGLLGIWKSR